MHISRRILAREAIALGALAISLALPAVAVAQGAGPGRGRMGAADRADARLIERNAEALGVDEKTLAEIKKIETDVKKSSDQKRESSMAARKRLVELMEQDLPNEDEALKQADAISRAGAEIQKDRIRANLKIRRLLTPEQRAELSELRNAARASRGGRGPAGRPRGAGGDEGKAKKPEKSDAAEKAAKTEDP